MSELRPLREVADPLEPGLDGEASSELTESPATGGAATTMRRSQDRGSSILLVGRILSLLLTVATQVVIVRALSKTDYGAFAYAFALAGSGQMLLSLGQGRLLSRFMATYEEQRDYARMFGSMILSVATIAATSTFSIAALYLFTGPLVGSVVHDPMAIQLVLIMIFIALMEALDMVFVALFAGFTRARAILFRKYLLTPGFRLAVVLLMLAFGASVTFLAIGYVLAQLLGILVYVALLLRVLRERGLLKHCSLRTFVIPYKSVFGFSVALLTAEFVVLSMHVGGVLQLDREPRAVAYSWPRKKANPAQVRDGTMAAHSILRSAVSWTESCVGTEMLRRYTPEDRWVSIKYEDFTAAPRATIENVLGRLGVDGEGPFTSDDTVVLGVNRTISGNPDRFRTGAVRIVEYDEWRGKVTLAEKAGVSAVTMPLLHRYQYDLHRHGRGQEQW